MVLPFKNSKKRFTASILHFTSRSISSLQDESSVKKKKEGSYWIYRSIKCRIEKIQILFNTFFTDGVQCPPFRPVAPKSRGRFVQNEISKF
jgi:hypothetical protein